MDRLVRSGVRMYSQESKDKALGMLRLTGDVEKTARMSGVPGRTLRRWAAAAAKPRQRSRGAKFEPYGDEVRGKAMEMARGGASCREIAEALGIGSPDVVRYWLKGGGTKEARMSGRSRRPEGDEPAYAGFEGSPEERIRQLELENDILRGAIDLLKAGSLDAMSNMEKAMLIDELRLETDRPLRELTGSLRISKSSYEYCRAKLRAKGRHAQLRADIRRIFDGAGGRRGYRYVHNELREEGTVVSEKVVRRLMAEEGCRVAYLKRRRRYSSYRGEISDAPPNLVDRNFRAGGPNELWLTDITEFKLPSGEKAYLSPIIDCFDGLVVSWRIGRRPDAALANGSLEDACGTLAPGQRPVCHSDRGCHYRWPGWIGICEENGLVRSMSRKGCSPDNSACEGFFGRLKNEFFYHRDWRGVAMESFMAQLDGYIRFYNERRKKQSLGWMSPMQYRISKGLAA